MTTQLHEQAIALLAQYLDSERQVEQKVAQLMTSLKASLSESRRLILSVSPHHLLKPDCELSNFPDYLDSGFCLPAQCTYIEDPLSGVMLGDTGPGKVGTHEKRWFVYLESFEASRVMQGEHPPALVSALAHERSVPAGTLRFVFGEIWNVSSLSLLPEVRATANIAFRELLTVSPSDVLVHQAPPTAPRGWHGSSARLKLEAGPPTQMSWASSATGAVLCAFKELAYLRALGF